MLEGTQTLVEEIQIHVRRNYQLNQEISIDGSIAWVSNFVESFQISDIEKSIFGPVSQNSESIIEHMIDETCLLYLNRIN